MAKLHIIYELQAFRPYFLCAQTCFFCFFADFFSVSFPHAVPKSTKNRFECHTLSIKMPHFNVRNATAQHSRSVAFETMKCGISDAGVWHFRHPYATFESPLVVDTETKQLLQLEVAVARSRLAAVIKTGVHVKFGGKVAVQHKIERIFPLDTHPFVTGQEVQT